MSNLWTGLKYTVVAPNNVDGYERVDWVKENFGKLPNDRWSFGDDITTEGSVYWFKYEEDALLFTMRWK